MEGKEDTIMLPVAEDELGGVEFAMFAEVTLTVGETSTGLLEKVHLPKTRLKFAEAIVGTLT